MTNSKNFVRILLVTGQEAALQLNPLHNKIIANKYHLFVHQCPVPIISLSSPTEILQSLQETYSTSQLTQFSFIMLSGLIPWNVTNLQSHFEAKVVKGPPFSSQIVPTLENLSKGDLYSLKFDFTNPESVGKEKLNKMTQSTLINLRKEQNEPYFTLSNAFSEIVFSPQLPAVLVGEVVDFPNISENALFAKIDSLLAHGAQIIDLGCIPHENHSEYIQKILPRLRKRYSIPFSIDSHNPSEIITAVENGISLILSITPLIIDRLNDFELIKDIPIVCISYTEEEIRKAISFEIPSKYAEISSKILQNSRLSQVRALIHFFFYLKGLGFKKILLDPLMQAPITPGFVRSLQRYIELKQQLDTLRKLEIKKNLWDPEQFPQLFAGISNVTELIDADSPGISALLAGIITEIGISGVLLTEHSGKCFKVIHEFKRGRDLMFLAKTRQIPPLNLGLDAFEFKSKRNYHPIPKNLLKDKVPIQVDSEISETHLDPLGFFRIYIDTQQNQIIVVHSPYSVLNTESMEGKEFETVFIGTSAENLAKRIIEEKFISRLDHAAYLGRELFRAERALFTGSDYHQE
ncbi:MAG: DUF4346 domain-containing protein [Promethearchaeota archaeon]